MQFSILSRQNLLVINFIAATKLYCITYYCLNLYLQNSHGRL